MKRRLFLLTLCITILMLLSFATLVGATTQIRFQDWRLAESPAGPCLKEIVSNFEQENPDIDVILDEVSVNDKIDKFIIQSQGGAPPDVVRILTTDVPGFVRMGLLRPLGDLVNKDGGESLTNQYNQFLINAMTINGELYGMPHEGDALVLYYNTKMFEEAGLDPDNPPKTWDEFVIASKKITDASKGRWAFGMLAHPSIACIWMQSWFLSNGSNFFNEEYTDTLLDSPEGIEALKFYVELYTKHGIVPPGPTDVDYAAALNLFVEEKVAIIAGPYATYGGILNANPDLKDKVKMMRFPGKVESSSGRGTVFSISYDSKNPEAAWKLIQFINKPENQMKFYKEATMLPTRAALFQSEEIKNNPKLKVMIEAIKYATSYPIYGKWNEANRSIVDALQAALLKVKTPEQAARDAAKEIRKIMND